MKLEELILCYVMSYNFLQVFNNGFQMLCPKCGSPNVIVTPVTTTTTVSKSKGFGWIKSCIGFLLFSLPGILCGLCGMGKGKTKVKHETKMVNICQNCGKQF